MNLYLICFEMNYERNQILKRKHVGIKIKQFFSLKITNTLKL